MGSSWKGRGTADNGGLSAAFQIQGDAMGTVSPGITVPLDLRFTNPHVEPMTVTHLKVTVRTLTAPRADRDHPCSVSDYRLTQLAASVAITLPPSATTGFQDLNIPQKRWPQVGMIYGDLEPGRLSGGHAQAGLHRLRRVGQLAREEHPQERLPRPAARRHVDVRPGGHRRRGLERCGKWEQDRDGSGTTVAVALSPATPTAALYPGGQADVVLTVTNTNTSPVRIGSLASDTARGTSGFAADAGHAGCVLSSLAFTTQTNGTTGWTVPAKVGSVNGTLAITLTNAVAMSLTAVDACQGATFTVYLVGAP